MPSRDDAMTLATDYFDSGEFESDLARRVAIPSESQTLEGLPHCARYLAEEMAPAFEAMGFECETFANPIERAGPILLATRIEDDALPTVLGYGHGDTVRGMEERWTRGAAPGRRRARASASTGAARPTTRASTPSTWRRCARCFRPGGGSASTPSS